VHKTVHPPGTRSPSSSILLGGDGELADVDEPGECSTVRLIVRNDVTRSGESVGYTLMSANSQIGELKRDTSGDGLIETGSELTRFGGSDLPRWLRFERSGTTFTASYSPDGSTWTEVETFDLAGANDVQDVGLCVTGLTTQNHRATFEAFEVTTRRSRRGERGRHRSVVPPPDSG